NPNNWNVIDKERSKGYINWPYQDHQDILVPKASQFIYLKGKESSLKFKKDFLDRPDVKASNRFILSFKFWGYEDADLPKIKVSIGKDYSDYISQDYVLGFRDQWLPRQYLLTYDQLKDFLLELAFFSNSVVALKDITLEYETQSTSKTMTRLNMASEMYLERGNSSRATMVTMTGPIDPTKCKIGDPISDIRNPGVECFQDENAKGFTKDENGFYTQVNDLNIDDTCFELTYLARKEVVINLQYLLSKEDFTRDHNILLSIKPKITTNGLNAETSTVCLKDLLALRGRSYTTQSDIPYVYISIKKLTAKANELYINFKRIIATPSTAWTDLFKQGTLRNYYDSTVYTGPSPFINWPVVIPNGPISADKNKFTILVTPEDERTANAHLITHWIKYDKNLATRKRPGQYRLTFKDSRAFSAFNIKPKVCDDLAHCTDVSIIDVKKDVHDPNQPPVSPSTWLYSFVMDEIPDTKYVKFMFEIEYSAHELIPGSLEAQIELITFGDPCQVPKTECEEIGRGKGNKCTNKAVSSAPNVCPCLYGYSGDRCEKVDYCMTGKSGQIVCDTSVASKACDREGSTHLVGDAGDKLKVYRCVCQNPAHLNELNWDKTAKVCKEAAIKLDRGWTQVGTDYYPSDASNEISYEFTDISTDRVDICSTIDYNLVNPTHTSNFFLTITSVADKYDAISLTKFTWSVESVLIGTMNMKLIAGLKSSDRWRNEYLFGDNKLTLDGTKFKSNTITIPPKTTTEIPIYLMSNWIEFNPKINDPLKPRISIDKILAANMNAVKIETGILWDTQDMSLLQLSRVAFVADKDIEQSLQITQYNKIQYFKLVIKFTLTNADTTPKTVDLAVTDVSIGDPCDKKVRNVCSNMGTCTAPVLPDIREYSPENYVCTCDSAHFGKDCELRRCVEVVARQTCDASPRYAMDIFNDVTNCEQQPTGTAYNCYCPNEYKMDSANHRCLSKVTYNSKTISCGLSGKTPGCEFFTLDTNIIKWSNEFEPQLTHDVKYKDIFPLYVSEISGDKLTQTFNNYDTTPTQQSDVAVYLVSQWIKKTTDSVDVWIKLTSKDFTGFAVQFVTFDGKTQESSAVDTVIGDSKIIQNAVTTFDGKLKIKVPAGTAWKFGIKVTYNTLDKELFTIDQFALNDPCAEPDTHSLINCATKDGNGVCKRFVKEHPELPYYCECDRRLFYDSSNDRFECTCPKIEQFYWDSRDDVMDCKNLPKCFTKGCNKVSEKCVEPPENRPAEDATCVAKEGYYKDPVSGVTTKIDICKVADRKIAKLVNEKPCDDDRAMCEHDFISPILYTCRCPPGFEAHGSGRSVSCTSRKCESPAFHTCQHKCENDDVDEKDGDHNTYVRGYKCGCNTQMYKQSGDTCTPTIPCTKCNGIANCFCDGAKDDSHRCFDGWDWTSDMKQCEIRDEKGGSCLGGSATKLDKPDATGRRYCLCDAPYVQSPDKRSCVLQGVCGQGGAGRTECNGIQALCRLTDPKSATDHPHECVCPPGTIQEAKGKLCQPVCKFRNRDLACNRINADCNPNKDVILVNEKPEHYCVCRPGLIMSNGKCMATEYTMKFSISIKNYLPFEALEYTLQPAYSLAPYENAPMQDWAGIYKDIESTNALNRALFDKNSADKQKAYERDMIEAEVVRLLAGVPQFEVAKDSIRLTKCTSGDYMSCDFTAVLKKDTDLKTNPINLGKYLEHLCHPLT
ncbi:unnamed protein product, partial [Medioppia subpectinata]